MPLFQPAYVLRNPGVRNGHHRSQTRACDRAPSLIAEVKPSVSIAARALSPVPCRATRLTLDRVVGESLSHSKQPLASLLQSYSHPIFRIGPCQLFPSDDCSVYRVRNVCCVGAFFIRLFEISAALGDAELNRFDLHHAHCVFNENYPGALALIFHLREYPRHCVEHFPFNLGYCQKGSTLELPNAEAMLVRTVLWVYGDRHLYLLRGEREPFGTLYESEFGEQLADFFYFDGNKSQRLRGETINRGLHVVPFARKY